MDVICVDLDEVHVDLLCLDLICVDLVCIDHIPLKFHEDSLSILYMTLNYVP